MYGNSSIGRGTLFAMQCPKAAMFDIDETLAPSFQSPAPEVVEKLLELLEKIPLALISGAGFERVQKDFLSTLEHASHIDRLCVLTNSASQAYTWTGGWNQEYNFALTHEERSKIRAAISAAAIELPVLREVQIHGEQIADREAQIAFTAVGLDAPNEYKRAWDPDAAKRRLIRAYLIPLLPEFDIRTGGASTIDITRKDINKAYGVRWFAERLGTTPDQMLYVGDALYEGGNDAVVVPTGIQTIKIESLAQTPGVLDQLNTVCQA